MSYAIETENLTHIYSQGTPFSRRALNDVCLRINEGELVALIGHTGCGKSTLVQHLNGLLKPTSGRVLVHGRDIWEKPSEIRKVRFEVGLVFQYPEYQLFEETAALDIAYGPKNMGMSDSEAKERAEAAARFTGLSDDILKKSPFELSGGEKRRVAIAGVLAMEPSVLILDEPTAGIDPEGSRELLDRIAEYRRTKGGTVIIVTHSMEDAARIADRIVVMSDGGLILDGTPSEVFSHGNELLSVGLDVPDVTKVMLLLRKAGLPVSASALTSADAAKDILRAGRWANA